MSKIAVLLPKEYMLEQARKVIQEKNADIDILKVIKTSDSVYEARKAMVADLEAQGLLVKVVPHSHSVGTHDAAALR